MTHIGDRAGEQLRAYQDRSLAHQGAEDYSALVAGAKQVHGKRVRRRRIAGSALVAAAAVAGVGFFAQPKDAPEVAEAPFAAALEGEGTKVAPPLGKPIRTAAQPRSLKFEGGEMTLASSSEAKVLSLHELGADVALMKGSIHCDIEPGRGGKWSIEAGEFRVTVVGTIFDVRYDKAGEDFSVEVERGIVDVTGPGIVGVKRLKAGESIELPEEIAPAKEAEADGPEAGTRTAVPESPSPSWKNLAEQGKYGEAMAQVESAGFSNTAGALNVSDLVRLADVARMAGRTDRATDLLHRIRKVAPGSHHAATAAYSLGTTAFDQRGDHVGAARWFSTYLRESPGGPLSREALGRMMEAQHRAGMTSAAADTARKYLKAYSSGPHRNLAQKLTAK